MEKTVEKKEEKTLDIAKEKIWHDVVRQLEEKGLLDKRTHSVDRKGTDEGKFLDLGARNRYYLHEIREKFNSWLSDYERETKISPQREKEIINNANRDVVAFFLQTHFVPFRTGALTEHATLDVKPEVSTKLATEGKPETQVGIRVDKTTHYGDSIYGTGVYYNFNKTKGVSVSANIQEGYVRVGTKEQRVGVTQSALDTFLSYSKKRFGFIAGLVAGPFTYGYNILNHTFTGGANWFVAGFNFLMDLVKDAQKRSEERGVGLGLELLKSLSPVNLVKTAVDVMIVKPVRKLKDAWDMVFKAGKVAPQKMSEVGYRKEMEKIEGDIALDNLNTAKKRLEVLIQHNIDPIAKAEVKNKLDEMEYRLASKGFPLGLNIFKPSTFLRSKRKMADEKLRKEMEGDIKELGQLFEKQKKGGLSEEEKKKSVYLYAYLSGKMEERRESREGFPISRSPVPFPSHNLIINQLRNTKPGFEGIMVEKAKLLSEKIESGANPEAVMQQHAWETKLMAIVGYGVFSKTGLGQSERKNLEEYAAYAWALSANEEISLDEMDTYSQGAKSGKMFEFYEGQLVKKAQKYKDDFANLARARAKKIGNFNEEIEANEKAAKESPEDTHKINAEIRTLEAERKAETERLRAIMKINERAKILEAYDKDLYAMCKKLSLA